MVFGGNALTQVLYGLTLASAAAATGADVGIADAVLINTVVTVFAGVLPIPGGDRCVRGRAHRRPRGDRHDASQPP